MYSISQITCVTKRFSSRLLHPAGHMSATTEYKTRLSSSIHEPTCNCGYGNLSISEREVTALAHDR